MEEVTDDDNDNNITTSRSKSSIQEEEQNTDRDLLMFPPSKDVETLLDEELYKMTRMEERKNDILHDVHGVAEIDTEAPAFFVKAFTSLSRQFHNSHVPCLICENYLLDDVSPMRWLSSEQSGGAKNGNCLDQTNWTEIFGWMIWMSLIGKPSLTNG
jgi:hypothetical protein